ncbi:MAG: copper resistance protein NlpE [Gemmatimonadetes bacterium]|nr:copper resistance protein NlpE [Gemmatimonadota bacterium]
MNARPLLAILATLLVAVPGCELEVDIDVEPERATVASPHRAVPPADPGAEVWGRHADIVVVDEPLAVDLELRLRPDRTFFLVAQVEDADGEVEREIVEGRYRWEDDRLTLVGEDGGGQTLRLRDGDLRLETGWQGDAAFAVTGLPRLELRRIR